MGLCLRPEVGKSSPASLIELMARLRAPSKGAAGGLDHAFEVLQFEEAK